MREYDLFVAAIAVLRAGMGMNEATLEIAQNHQPRTSGRPTTRALLLEKVGERRYGHVKREDVPDPDDAGLMIHRETQIYETTLQVNGMAKPPPAPPAALDMSEPTGADLANQAAAVLQSDAAIAAFRALDIGVLRITDVRNPKFRNDRDQFEASASFDFILTHKQITVTTTPAAIVGELVVASV